MIAKDMISLDYFANTGLVFRDLSERMKSPSMLFMHQSPISVLVRMIMHVEP